MHERVCFFFACMCVHTLLSRFGSQVFQVRVSGNYWLKPKDQLKVCEWQ